MSRRQRRNEITPLPPVPPAPPKKPVPRVFTAQEQDDFRLLLGLLASRLQDAIIFWEQDLREQTGNLPNVNYEAAMAQLRESDLPECGQGGAYHIPWGKLKKWKAW